MLLGIGLLVCFPWVNPFTPTMVLVDSVVLMTCIFAIILAARQKARSSVQMASIGLFTILVPYIYVFGLLSLMALRFDYAGARRARCMSTSRQIGLALRLYADDYDGRWPPASNWRPLVNGYIKNRSDEPDVFQCPSAAEKKYSYGMNINTSGIAELTITNPATTVAVFDCSMPLFNAFGGRDAVDFRHLKGSAKLANITFTDGHAMAVNSTKAKITNAMSIDQVRWKP